GHSVVLYDLKAELTDKGLAAITTNLDIGVEKKKVTPADRNAALERIKTSTSLKDVADCDLVIEAVPEKIELKQQLFRELSGLVRDDCILASNTSSLSLTEIAAAASHPRRVVGMHFFNPVHLMKLLELVRAHQTSDGTLGAARAAGERMGKQVIVVKDHPGFASSRLGIVLG